MTFILGVSIAFIAGVVTGFFGLFAIACLSMRGNDANDANEVEVTQTLDLLENAMFSKDSRD